MDFLLGLIQLIRMHITIFIVVCFDMWLQMQNRRKKVWSGNFYAFQNRVEITGPNIDIDKIAQAGKDLDMILGFKSINLLFNPKCIWVNYKSEPEE